MEEDWVKRFDEEEAKRKRATLYSRLEKVLGGIKADVQSGRIPKKLAAFIPFDTDSYEFKPMGNSNYANTHADSLIFNKGRRRWFPASPKSFKISYDEGRVLEEGEERFKHATIHEIAHIIDYSINGKQSEQHPRTWFSYAERLGMELPAAYYRCSKCGNETCLEDFDRGMPPVALPISTPETRHKCERDGARYMLFWLNEQKLLSGGKKNRITGYRRACKEAGIGLIIHKDANKIKKGVRMLSIDELLSKYSIAEWGGKELVEGTIVPVTSILVLYDSEGIRMNKNQLDGKIRMVEIPKGYRSTRMFSGLLKEAQKYVSGKSGVDRLGAYNAFVHGKISKGYDTNYLTRTGAIMSLDFIISNGIGNCAESSVVLKLLLDEDLTLKQEGWDYSIGIGFGTGINSKYGHMWVEAKGSLGIIALDAKNGHVFLKENYNEGINGYNKISYSNIYLPV